MLNPFLALATMEDNEPTCKNCRFHGMELGIPACFVAPVRVPRAGQDLACMNFIPSRPTESERHVATMLAIGGMEIVAEDRS